MRQRFAYILWVGLNEKIYLLYDCRQCQNKFDIFVYKIVFWIWPPPLHLRHYDKMLKICVFDFCYCSGLDNVSTSYTIKLLRRLAHQGRTIVCTIHQPSASLFQLFDNVYVLSKGQCMYQGATEQMVPFLSSAGFECPTHYNPADFSKLF